MAFTAHTTVPHMERGTINTSLLNNHHTQQTLNLTQCQALVIICKVQPSLSTMLTHTPLNTNIIRSILYTQYCNKATHTQTTNTSVSLAAWPCRYCRCHTLSETDSALPAFIYIAGKCDFSLPQFPRLFVCIRYCRVFTVCIRLQIYPL